MVTEEKGAVLALTHVQVTCSGNLGTSRVPTENRNHLPRPVPLRARCTCTHTAATQGHAGRAGMGSGQLPLTESSSDLILVSHLFL